MRSTTLLPCSSACRSSRTKTHSHSWAPRVGGAGWAVATLIERTLKSRMSEQVGIATAEEMEQVDIALRAALSLD